MNSSEKLFEIWGGTPQLLDPKLCKSTIWGIKPHGGDVNYSEVQMTIESYLGELGELYRPPKGFDYSSIEEEKIIIKLYSAIPTDEIPVGMVEASTLPNIRGWVEWTTLAVGNLSLKKGKKGDYIVSNFCFFEGLEFHGTGSGRTSLIATSIEEVLGQLI